MQIATGFEQRCDTFRANLGASRLWLGQSSCEWETPYPEPVAFASKPSTSPSFRFARVLRERVFGFALHVSAQQRARGMSRVPEARRLEGYGTFVRELLSARIDEYLRAHPCVDCGESNLNVLDFDHLRDKTDDVANMVAGGRPWSEIEWEIAKCEVCCANCHARRTAQWIGGYKIARRPGLTVTPERIELSPSVS